jgi:HSP20 family protein
MAMLFDPFRELDRVAANLLDSRQGPRLMPIDLYRDGDHYILNADLPGIDPGSVDVDVDGQVLTIRAERTPRSQEGVKWLAHERPSGSFLRQLNLGDGIATENISANYNNGVLSVMIPVSERAKPRKVEITSSGASTPVEIEQGQQ